MENTVTLKKIPEPQEEIDVSKIVPINRRTWRDRLAEYRRKPFSMAAMLLVVLAAALMTGAVLWVVLYAFVQGIPNLKPELFEWTNTTANNSMMPAIVNTLIVAAMSLVFAVPVGVFAAIFMVEYAKSTNFFVKAVRMAAETLSGIPSIVYGIFGMLFFVEACGWGYSMMAGILTMAIMILPLIMRTTEEALKAVPDSFREGSYALGAGKLRTIFVIILPSAMSGIVSGVILGLGRVVGETAALIYTAGTVAAVPSSLMGSGCTLAVFMYSLYRENIAPEVAWATGVVLILLVVVINGIAEFVGNKLKKEYN